MNKLFFIALALVSFQVFGQSGEIPVVKTDYEKNNRRFNPYKSHWLVSLGLEGLEYDTPFRFTGQKNDINPKKQELYGGRLGIGRELYLGGGLNTVTKAEAYFVGTLFAKTATAADEDPDVIVSRIKRTGQVFGFEGSQSIGWLFDLKTKNPFMNEMTYLTVEPFVEAGIGIANAHNRVHYDYETSFVEGYGHTMRDTLANTRLGAGINFTSTNGYFFYLKATVNRYDILSRKVDSYKYKQGTTASTYALRDKDSSTENDAQLDPITMYTIGGGYKF
jgi:hypothetical protein